MNASTQWWVLSDSHHLDQDYYSGLLTNTWLAIYRLIWFLLIMLYLTATLFIDVSVNVSLRLCLSLQEIDGKALMLLRSDIIMKYMGLKLGPALKLCHYIEKLKQTKQ